MTRRNARERERAKSNKKKKILENFNDKNPSTNRFRSRCACVCDFVVVVSYALVASLNSTVCGLLNFTANINFLFERMADKGTNTMKNKANCVHLSVEWNATMFESEKSM